MNGFLPGSLQVPAPDAIAQARAWEEGKHDVPIDIGSGSDEDGPATMDSPFT